MTTSRLFFLFWAGTVCSLVNGFLPPKHGRFSQPFSSRTSLGMASQPSLVVISPPGGIGETTSVNAAKLGGKVRWVVVSTLAGNIEFADYVLDEIEKAGGSLELAGAPARSLLNENEKAGALAALETWCRSVDGIVCTMDGIDDLIPKRFVSNRAINDDTVEVMTKSILVASRAAADATASSTTAKKLAVLSAIDGMTESDKKEDGGKGGLLSKIGLGRESEMTSLPEALGVGAAPVTILRHGELIGTPDSQPNFSPLLKGPLKQPKLREELTIQAIRIDSTISLSGNILMGKTTRSTRLSVGEAAARMAMGLVDVRQGVDLSLSSVPGTEPVPDEFWKLEFERIEERIASGKTAELFTAEFSNVPDVPRMANWIATKWAPAVLRSYDIAAIRIGARPVSVLRPGDSSVELVWQQLVDFESVTVGRMLIEVTQTGITATRGPGDPAKGFGSISKKPLNGENLLVRRLAEAAAQAVEKGLAKKAQPKAVPKQFTAPPPVQPSTPAMSTEPSTATRRRSTERLRGKRRKESLDSGAKES